MLKNKKNVDIRQCLISTFFFVESTIFQSLDQSF